MQAQEDIPSTGKKTILGLIWSTSEIWGGQIIQFLVFLVLARLVRPEAFGMVALLSIFIGFAAEVAVIGLAEALIQKHKVDDLHINSVFWSGLTLNILLSGFLIFSAGQIAFWLHQPRFAPVLRWSCPILIVLFLAGIQETQFRRELNFRPSAIRRFSGNIIGGCCGIILAFAGAGVYALVALSWASALTGCFLLWYQSAWRPSLVFSMRAIKELLPYGSQSLGSSLLLMVNRRSDGFIVGSVLGAVALGFYTVAYRILLVLNYTITLVVQQVAFPALARLHPQPARMLSAFRRTTHASSLLAFGVFTGVAVLAPVLIPVVFGAQWQPSIPTMRILAIVGLIQNILFFNDVLWRSMGRPGYTTFFFALNAVANVAGFLVFAHYGIFAVAIVLLVNTVALSPVSFMILKRLTGIHLLSYLRQFLAPFGAALLASLLTLAMVSHWNSPQQTLGFLFLSTLVFGSSYVSLLVLFDHKFIRELIQFAVSAMPAAYQSNIFQLRQWLVGWNRSL
ncbi:MAG TPA: lipopolysaccharide biosynthesis protein [Terriglobales bacterium]|nr:lipopolysaccharide biosynthesis protein [Terriglobales bacterium]